MGTDKKVMAYLSYIGILSLIPFFSEKNDEFVQYHAKQGLNLFIIEVAFTIISQILFVIANADIFGVTFWFLALIITIFSRFIYALFFAMSILGIVNVSKGLQVPLPVLGSIQIIK